MPTDHREEALSRGILSSRHDGGVSCLASGMEFVKGEELENCRCMKELVIADQAA